MPRRDFLAFVVLARRLDAEVFVACVEVDFLVRADFLVFINRQFFSLEIRIRRGLGTGSGGLWRSRPK